MNYSDKNMNYSDKNMNYSDKDMSYCDIFYIFGRVLMFYVGFKSLWVLFPVVCGAIVIPMEPKRLRDLMCRKISQSLRLLSK